MYCLHQLLFFTVINGNTKNKKKCSLQISAGTPPLCQPSAAIDVAAELLWLRFRQAAPPRGGFGDPPRYFIASRRASFQSNGPSEGRARIIDHVIVSGRKRINWGMGNSHGGLTANDKLRNYGKQRTNFDKGLFFLLRKEDFYE